MKKKAIIKAYKREKKSRTNKVLKQVTSPKNLTDRFMRNVAEWSYNENPANPETVPYTRGKLMQLYSNAFLEENGHEMKQKNRIIADAIINQLLK